MFFDRRWWWCEREATEEGRRDEGDEAAARRGDVVGAAAAAQGEGLPGRGHRHGCARLHPLHRPRPRQPLRRRRGRARARHRRPYLQAHQGEDLRRFVPFRPFHTRSRSVEIARPVPASLGSRIL